MARVDQDEATALRLRERSSQREADAAPGALARPPLEDRVDLDHHTPALIDDIDRDTSPDRVRLHPHNTGAVLGGIGDQDLKDLPDGTRRRMSGRCVGIEVDAQRATEGGETAVPTSLEPVNHITKVDRAAVRVDIPRQREQVVDRGLEPVDFAQRDSQRRPRIRRRTRERTLEMESEPCEWGSELMRRVRAERALTVDEASKTLRCDLEVAGRCVEFGYPRPFEANGEVAATEPLRSRREVRDRFGDSATASGRPPRQWRGGRRRAHP